MIGGLGMLIGDYPLTESQTHNDSEPTLTLSYFLTDKTVQL